ncbi:Two-component response regulator, YesN/AraC family, consists of REC and AraC-type DNA-binding domains [Paenibacillus sp. UNCCL117]|uniref:response regulator n=1 Tax=unclassified Paenibacillus TaxID=185978 RepID=UPI00088C12A1|nr:MULTISPECIES: response regulator [unclassified Paenibacillus]SDE45902.1 Two-component response regulator, YesN/AraC family, consists of REC and AraC-type DNA-binding domains [Paenibacillus sp. cl123]SFW65968.1 Two-component response regulator, YesN/AraC family, consists of REC and AraC-type DNA-binding domains [Paenibacillus sp. UNCCL117]
MGTAIDLLIIEDEADVLEGIRASLKLLEPQLGSIYSLGNAEDAREMIRAKLPKVIVTDIVLPRQSGLELLEEVMRLPGYSPKVIVISCHNDFAYAQQSLRLGALDYVLKPFDSSELNRKLENIIAMIREEERISSELRLRSEHASVGAKLMMDQQLLGFCTKKTQLQEHIYHRLQLWGLTWLTTAPYRLMAFCVGDLPERDKEAELQVFTVGNIAEETLGDFAPSYLLKNVHNRWIVISAYPDADRLLEAIRDNVRRYQRLELNCGVSERMHAFQSLSEAYEQANQALRWAAVNRLEQLCYSDLAELGQEADARNLDEQCAAALIGGDPDHLREVIGHKVDGLVRFTHLPQRKLLAQSCLDWITSVQTVVHAKTGLQLDHIPLSLWERLERYETIDSVKRDLYEFFKALSAQISSQAPGMGNAIIEQAKALIADGDRFDITQQELAAKLAIHPVWLSHLFKKETGQTFSDYMIDLRIEKSKALLRETPYKIYEIASMIGYQDLQYFGKLFKKRTGLSPKEYRYGK